MSLTILGISLLLMAGGMYLRHALRQPSVGVLPKASKAGALVKKMVKVDRVSEPAKYTGRYAGGSIKLSRGKAACPSARAQLNKKFLMKDLPSLPLEGCGTSQCHCGYAYFNDRRDGADRRDGEDRRGEIRFVQPRREGKDRRKGVHNWNGLH